MKTFLKLLYFEKQYFDNEDPTITLWKVTWDKIAGTWDNYLSCARCELLSNHNWGPKLRRLLNKRTSKSLVLTRAKEKPDDWWRQTEI